MYKWGLLRVSVEGAVKYREVNGVVRLSSPYFKNSVKSCSTALSCCILLLKCFLLYQKWYQKMLSPQRLTKGLPILPMLFSHLKVLLG